MKDWKISRRTRTKTQQWREWKRRITKGVCWISTKCINKSKRLCFRNDNNQYRYVEKIIWFTYSHRRQEFEYWRLIVDDEKQIERKRRLIFNRDKQKSVRTHSNRWECNEAFILTFQEKFDQVIHDRRENFRRLKSSIRWFQ